MQRSRWPWVAAVGGSSAAALALALPWGASGQRWRSAYALIRLTRQLDIAHGALAGTFAACVALTPILAAAAWVAAAVRWRRSTQLLAAAVAALTLATAYAVLRSPLRAGAGLTVGVVAGVVTLLGVGTLRER